MSYAWRASLSQSCSRLCLNVVFEADLAPARELTTTSTFGKRVRFKRNDSRTARLMRFRLTALPTDFAETDNPSRACGEELEREMI